MEVLPKQLPKSGNDPAKVEAELLRKAEDELLKITKEAAETRRKQLALSYDRQIADYKKKLAEDKTLTEQSKTAILSIIDSLGKQKEAAMAEFDTEELKKRIEHQSKLIELQLRAVEEGSNAELTLKMEQLQKQEELELAQAQRDYENEEERQIALCRHSREI